MKVVDTFCLCRVTYYFNTGTYGVGVTYLGDKFIFDWEDLEKIEGYLWCLDKNGYLVAFTKDSKGRRKIVRMHQLIKGKRRKGKLIDHIRNTEGLSSRKLDNRKSNLRYVTPAQNSWNRGINSNNTSGHKGVYWVESGKRWLAKVIKNGKATTKRFPPDQYKAACRWQEKTARKLFGKFAYQYDTAAYA